MACFTRSLLPAPSTDSLREVADTGSWSIHPRNSHPKDRPASWVWPPQFWQLHGTWVSLAFSPLHSELEVIPIGLTSEHPRARYWELKLSVKLDFCNAFIREKIDWRSWFFGFFYILSERVKQGWINNLWLILEGLKGPLKRGLWL